MASFTTEKMKFSIKDLFINCDDADLITFTEEIHNGKLHFLCSDCYPSQNSGYSPFKEII